MGQIVIDIERADTSVVSRFAKVSTPSVHEVMHKKGAMDSDIRPLWSGIKMLGTAITVAAHAADNLTLHQAIYVAQPGDILVVNAGGYLDAGMWGDITTTAAMERGIKGLVIDGSVRDTGEITKMEFPVFSRGISMKGTSKASLGDINRPISCAGVTVNPGDVVLGDDDGVVIIPREEAARVLERALEKERNEEQIRQSLRNGATTLELLGFDKVVDTLKESA